MDFGARYEGYCSDMTRTVCIGRANEEMKRLYDIVLQSQKLALKKIKAGELCRDIDAVARDYINSMGFEGKFGHSLGHGVGMLVHESPRLSSAAGEKRLMSGNIVTVEPGIYLEGQYGCRIEDMVLVTDDGCENFTKSTKEFIEIS
jgi:Xaa-Pro aminopeptidase